MWLGVSLSHFQSNHEGELIDKIHALHGECDGIVINPGAVDSNTASHSHTRHTSSASATLSLGSISHAREPGPRSTYLDLRDSLLAAIDLVRAARTTPSVIRYTPLSLFLRVTGTMTPELEAISFTRG